MDEQEQPGRPEQKHRLPKMLTFLLALLLALDATAALVLLALWLVGLTGR